MKIDSKVFLRKFVDKLEAQSWGLLEPAWFEPNIDEIGLGEPELSWAKDLQVIVQETLKECEKK